MPGTHARLVLPTVAALRHYEAMTEAPGARIEDSTNCITSLVDHIRSGDSSSNF
jgi:hypothetical protein